MIRRPPRSTLDRSSAASDVYKRQTLPQLNISVFPTLTTGILHIETSELYEDLNVEVYNTLGQKLTTDILNGASNEINISNLNSGEYLLRFISHSAVTVKQVTLIK